MIDCSNLTGWLRKNLFGKSKRGQYKGSSSTLTDGPIASEGSFRKLPGLSQKIHGGVTQEGSIDRVLDNVITVIKSSLKFETVGFVVLKDKRSQYYSTVFDSAPELDRTRGIGKLCTHQRSLIVIDDAANDGRFDSVMDKQFECTTINMMCGPIIVEGSVFGILYALNKLQCINVSSSSRSPVSNRVVPGGSYCDLTPTDRVMFQEVLDNATIALKTSATISTSVRENRRADAMIALVRARTSGKPLSTILNTTADIIDQLLLPGMTLLYLCDQMRSEVFVCACNPRNGMEGCTVSFGQGAAGTVASTGAPLRMDHAYDDARFLPTMDQHLGRITNTLLCVPVPGFANSSPIAVIEVINKSSNQCFDEDDQDSLVALAKELSLCLKAHAEELYELHESSLTGRASQRINMDNKKQRMSGQGQPAWLETCLLQEFGENKNRFRLSTSAKKVSLAKEKEKELFRDWVDDCSPLSSFREAVVQSPQRMSAMKANSLISNYNTSPFDISDDDLVELLVHMFRSYGLISQYSIDETLLMRFLTHVKDCYHTKNPFHNFKHVWSVAHLCYQILRAGADQYLTSLDILALLIAAICHDIDHPGNNNAFEVACQSELAVLYADDTVLERHHIATTLKLLKGQQHSFLGHLSPSDLCCIRHVIRSAIMATDMGNHFGIVGQLTKLTTEAVPFHMDSSESREKLVRYVLHASDIGAQTQCLSLALLWSDRVTGEFSSQYDQEIKLGLNPTTFMEGLEDELKRMQLQHGFVNGIVLPLWSALADIFPGLQESTTRAKINKQFYLDRINELTQARNGENNLQI